MRNKHFDFLAHFIDLTDPRADRGWNHQLTDLVALALCAMLCGADNWADVERFSVSNQEWFEQYLDLPEGIPSHDTFSRVFAILDCAEFEQCLRRWAAQLKQDMNGETVAIDGKTLRRSHDRSRGQKPLHIVTAWANSIQFGLGQVAVDDKSNEIPAVQELVSILNLKNAVVTADAMHCQKKTARLIIEQEADYVLQVKENQKTLHDEINAEFDRLIEMDSSRVRRQTITEKNRGREELRTCIVAPAPAALRKRWCGLKTIGMIYRVRTDVDGSESEELRFFISSLEPKVRQCANHVRAHWGIETSLHHTLDVTFGEDASRIRKKNGPEIAAALRRLALSILKSDTTIKDNVRGKRLMAGWNLENLKGILTDSQAI